MSASKAKGTKWETEVVRFLQSSGAPYAERRALHGTGDRGDVSGIPGVVIECKNVATASLGSWLDEAEKERANDRADLGVVWHHRRGKANAADGIVSMTGATLVRLLAAAGYIARAEVAA